MTKFYNHFLYFDISLPIYTAYCIKTGHICREIEQIYDPYICREISLPKTHPFLPHALLLTDKYPWKQRQVSDEVARCLISRRIFRKFLTHPPHSTPPLNNGLKERFGTSSTSLSIQFLFTV